MERNKLENEFRKQLNSREIKPSEMAWDKLDAKLTAEEKKSIPRYSWLYVAASFVGFLLIAAFYFSQKENTIENQKNGLVIQDSVAPKPDAIPSKEVDSKIEEKSLVVDVFKQSASKSDKSSVSKKDSLVNKNNLNQNQVAEFSIINQVKENEIMVNSSEKQSYESLSKNKYVSAEKLLAEVSNAKFEPKAIDKINGKTKRHISVNPSRLLSDAETELNQSYRESALDRINKNFKAIKTVLVNRNYEE